MGEVEVSVREQAVEVQIAKWQVVAEQEGVEEEAAAEETKRSVVNSTTPSRLSQPAASPNE